MKDIIIDITGILGCIALVLIVFFSVTLAFEAATRSIVREMLKEQETRLLELRKADREHAEQPCKPEKPGASI